MHTNADNEKSCSHDQNARDALSMTHFRLLLAYKGAAAGRTMGGGPAAAGGVNAMRSHYAGTLLEEGGRCGENWPAPHSSTSLGTNLGSPPARVTSTTCCACSTAMRSMCGRQDS